MVEPSRARTSGPTARDPSTPRRRLVVAGASGLVGRRLVAMARADHDYDVTVLTRRITGDEPEGAEVVAWQPDAAAGDSVDEAALAPVVAALEGADALVNLAGASIDDGRLGPQHRARVTNSRVHSVQTLLAAAQRCSEPPDVWFQISNVGYYGDRGDAPLDEAAGPQPGHALSESSAAVEAAVRPAASLARLVVGRLAVVFAPEASVWKRLLLPIRLFVGGPLGSGRQWFPWIDGADAVRAILFLLEHDEATGAFNLSAPTPARQIEITRAAARELGRPAIVPVPAWALRIVLGEVADLLLLTSARVLPARLQELGFNFEAPDIVAEVSKLLD